MNDLIEAPAEAAVFSIPSVNWPDFQAKFAELGKKAAKLGVEAPSFEVIEVVEVPVFLEGPGHVQIGVNEIRKVIVSGKAPRVAGWALVAVIDYSEGATIVHAVGDDFDPAWWKIDKGFCDHCGTDRLRNKVVVVAHDSGERKVVGTTCLKDFLGHKSPEALASWAEFVADLDFGEFEDKDFGGSGAPIKFGIVEMLALASHVIGVDGWVPRSAQFGKPTANTVTDLLLGGKVAREWFDENDVPTEANEAEAVAAKAWAEAIDDAAAFKSDYLANLRALAGLDEVKLDKVGLLASLIPAFRKAEGREIERKARAAADADSVHFGEVKQRLSVAATISLILSFDGDYGVRSLVKGITEEGNVVIWWASGTPDLEAGDRIVGKATVKGHDVRDGVAQTVVNRWAWITVEDGETPEDAIKRDAAEVKAAKAAAKVHAAKMEEKAEVQKLIAFLAAPHRFFDPEVLAERVAAAKHERQVERLINVLAHPEVWATSETMRARREREREVRHLLEFLAAPHRYDTPEGHRARREREWELEREVRRLVAFLAHPSMFDTVENHLARREARRVAVAAAEAGA